MYILLILFFGSLVAIIFMISRKLILIKNGGIPYHEEAFLKTPYMEEWKYLTIEKMKKHGYSILVGTIRVYVRGVSFIKNKYQEGKEKVLRTFAKSEGALANSAAHKEKVNGFLKMISEYKRKIRILKHKIKEEENL